jgi:hypothetical protein
VSESCGEDGSYIRIRVSRNKHKISFSTIREPRIFSRRVGTGLLHGLFRCAQYLERDDVHESATDASRLQDSPMSKMDKFGYYLCGRVIFLVLQPLVGCGISPPTLSATPRFRACGGALKAGPANQQRLGVRYWHDVLGSAAKVTGVKKVNFWQDKDK